MKLYATVKNERGGKKSTGDDTRILVELSYKNKIVGTVGLYAILDDKVEGYRVIWSDERGWKESNVIREEEKGKTQQSELVPCNKHREFNSSCLACNERNPL